MKKVFGYLLVFGLFIGFLGLSLSCASDDVPEEPKSTITLEDVNALMKNQEANALTNNGLTADQLMEVTKLCIQTGELTGVSILDENTKLSFAVLESNLTICKIPMIVKFSFSISKNGTLRLRVLEIREVSPDVNPFSVTVPSKEVDSQMNMINSTVLNHLDKIGTTIMNRSSDFS